MIDLHSHILSGLDDGAPDMATSVAMASMAVADGTTHMAYMPHIYPVSAGTTLLDAIAMAGGFRDVADQKKVYVFRDVGGSKLVANYDVGDIRSGRLVNPRIYGGDVIMVFTSQSRVAINNLKEALGIAVNASRLAVIP